LYGCRLFGANGVIDFFTSVHLFVGPYSLVIFRVRAKRLAQLRKVKSLADFFHFEEGHAYELGYGDYH
jgi:hypothetical protein